LSAAGKGASAGPLLVMVSSVAVLGCGPWMVRLAQIGPLASAFWRLALAVPVLLLLCRVLHIRLGALRAGGLSMAGAGLCYGLGTAALNAAALQTSLANCALIGNLSSLFLAAIGLASHRQRPAPLMLAGIACAIIGLVLLLGRSVTLSAEHVLGDGFAFVAAVLFTGYFLLIGRAGSTASPIAVHTIATLVGAITLAPLAISGPLVPGHWWPVIVLAIGGQAIGQGLIVYSVAHLSRVVAGLCILVFPVVSGMIGWLVYGEMLSTTQLAGAALILGSLPLVKLAEAAATAAPATPR
jgi:drug/metabolite transporter (DMT)-like permease